MTVETILAGGFGLLKRHPRAIAYWAALYMLFAIASYLLMRPMLIPLMDMQRDMMAAQTSGQVMVPTFPSGFFAALLLIYVGMAVVMAMTFAAAVRTVARGEEGTLGNLRLGWDELRLIGLALIIVIGIYIAMFVTVLVAALVIAGLYAVSPILGILVAIPTFIGFFCAIIYVEVRLSLAGAMTVLQRRFVLTEAWRATKGRFWTLFAAYFILWVIMIVLYFVLIAISAPWLFSAMTSPEAMQAGAQKQMAAQMNGIGLRLIVQWVLGGAVITAMMAVTSGAVATAALSVGSET